MIVDWTDEEHDNTAEEVGYGDVKQDCDKYFDYCIYNKWVFLFNLMQKI